jgi:hypothetical protein
VRRIAGAARKAGARARVSPGERVRGAAQLARRRGRRVCRSGQGVPRRLENALVSYVLGIPWLAPLCSVPRFVSLSSSCRCFPVLTSPACPKRSDFGCKIVRKRPCTTPARRSVSFAYHMLINITVCTVAALMVKSEFKCRLVGARILSLVHGVDFIITEHQLIPAKTRHKLPAIGQFLHRTLGMAKNGNDPPLVLWR